MDNPNHMIRVSAPWVWCGPRFYEVGSVTLSQSWHSRWICIPLLEVLHSNSKKHVNNPRFIAAWCSSRLHSRVFLPHIRIFVIVQETIKLKKSLWFDSAQIFRAYFYVIINYGHILISDCSVYLSHHCTCGVKKKKLPLHLPVFLALSTGVQLLILQYPGRWV